MLRSVSSLPIPFETGWKKLGHPVPDSNFVSELKSGVPQTMHWEVPFSWLSSTSR